MQKGNAFAGMVAGLDSGGFTLLSSAVRARECREAFGFGAFADAAGVYRLEPACASCVARGAWWDGHEESGLQRFRCRGCGRRYNSLAGTVFEHSKADMAAWVQFVRLMLFNVPLDAVAEVCGVSHKVAWEWRHRVFATVGLSGPGRPEGQGVDRRDVYCGHGPLPRIRAGKEARALSATH